MEQVCKTRLPYKNKRWPEAAGKVRKMMDKKNENGNELGLDEIIITGRRDETDRITYEVRKKDVPARCRKEGCVHNQLYKHSHTDTVVVDRKKDGKHVDIKIRVNRYICPRCRSVFSDDFDFFVKGEAITKRLKKEIAERYYAGETYTQISKEYGISWSPVKKAITEYSASEKVPEDKKKSKAILGVYEIDMCAKHRWLLINHQDGTIIDILPDNKAETMVQYIIEQGYSYVNTGIHPQLVKALHENCRKVTVSIDKSFVFEAVIKQLNDILNRIGDDRALDKKYRYTARKAATLQKASWYTLPKHFKEHIKEWPETLPPVYEIYMMGICLQDIYRYAIDGKDAKDLLSLWMNTLPQKETEPIREVITGYMTEIGNYWKIKDNIAVGWKGEGKPGLQHVSDIIHSITKIRTNNRDNMEFEIAKTKQLTLLQNNFQTLFADEESKRQEDIKEQEKFHTLYTPWAFFPSGIDISGVSRADILKLYLQYNVREQNQVANTYVEHMDEYARKLKEAVEQNGHANSQG